MAPDTIYVAPLSLVESTIEDAKVSHLVTLINGETLVPTPLSITPDRHLRLDMNDICEPITGLVLPCEEHVADLVQFALDWDREAPLLIRGLVPPGAHDCRSRDDRARRDRRGRASVRTLRPARGLIDG